MTAKAVRLFLRSFLSYQQHHSHVSDARASRTFNSEMHRKAFQQRSPVKPEYLGLSDYQYHDEVYWRYMILP